MKKIVKHNGTPKAIADRYTSLELMPFVANPRKVLGYKIEKWTRDEDRHIKVTYSGVEQLKVFDGKVALTLFKMIMDANSHNSDPEDDALLPDDIEEKGKFVKLVVNVRDMANFISGKATIRERRIIYESMVRIKGLNIDKVEYTNDGEKASSYGWIASIDSTLNYEHVTVWINKKAIEDTFSNKLSYNLKTAIGYDGYSNLLYLHMQTWRYKKAANKYYYSKYVEHTSVIQALNIEDLTLKKQLEIIRKAFSEININYSFKKGQYNHAEKYFMNPHKWIKQDNRIGHTG